MHLCTIIKDRIKEIAMPDQFSRTRMLLGEEGIDKLQHSKVAIFGIGGVGGYVAEALARSGVGSFVLVDDDKVCLTNINRQIIALRSTVGQDKHYYESQGSESTCNKLYGSRQQT